MATMALAVVAPDKWRGSASATEVAHAIAAGATQAGWDVDVAPVSDGGEGFASAMGGSARKLRVHGPLGQPVAAVWRQLERGVAVVEMAEASGLILAGGSAGNDPIAATTYGTGELIAAAVRDGARRVLVGAGGSASTDGGWAALKALEPHARLGGIELIVGCDVRTLFLDAATEFAPQKGATPVQVELLSRRLARLAQLYEDRFGVDVRPLCGSGAAGGLAGGLAAIGAELVSGFALVAERIRLAERIAEADLVITGEGMVDAQSFRGKVVGQVLQLARLSRTPVLILAGEVSTAAPPASAAETDLMGCFSLVSEMGEERAWRDTLPALSELAATVLRAYH
jgi:glycerate kinase